MGQTPWSARDPLVPLFLSGLARLCRFAWRPSFGREVPEADQGVRKGTDLRFAMVYSTKLTEARQRL